MWLDITDTVAGTPRVTIKRHMVALLATMSTKEQEKLSVNLVAHDKQAPAESEEREGDGTQLEALAPVAAADKRNRADGDSNSCQNHT